jgi:hypothetical protein
LADERANKASHDAQHFEGTYIFWSSFSHLEPAVASMPPLLKTTLLSKRFHTLRQSPFNKVLLWAISHTAFYFFPV